MFATLLGALPAPRTGDPAAALSAVVAAQEAAGLEPLADGRGALDLGAGQSDTVAGPVERWRATAALTQRAVKQVLRGPWSAVVGADPTMGSEPRARAVLARAEAIREQVLALAAAGCPLVEIEETDADRIGPDEGARRLFREAHARVARDIPRTHLSLSIVGGSAWEAGAATILDPPYNSLAVDLVAGPDNWRLVALAPADRGIVAGALDVRPGVAEGPEVLIWAARYAASTMGRSLARVGLGTGGGLAHLTWDHAIARLRVLGEAVRIESLPEEERADAIDPRAVSIRAAALGRTRHSERKGRAGAEG